MSGPYPTAEEPDQHEGRHLTLQGSCGLPGMGTIAAVSDAALVSPDETVGHRGVRFEPGSYMDASEVTHHADHAPQRLVAHRPGRGTPGPDFFIVGAPRCGTTALNSYLAQHPAVFMARKEQHFFGSDLRMRWGARPAELYFASFAGGESVQRRGEASTFYLSSRRAAEEIHAFNPRAQVIMILRNPLEMLPSLHTEYLYHRIEVIESFEEALAAEAARRRGERIPRRSMFPDALRYRDMADYAEQLRRYLSAFGAEQVHVILYDDLVTQAGETFRHTLEFLGVDPTFVPSFDVINASKRWRSKRLGWMLSNAYDASSIAWRVCSRVPWLRATWRYGAHTVVPAVAELNTVTVPRPPLHPRLEARLAIELAPGIDKLGQLIGRDLSHWYVSRSRDEHLPM